MKILFLFLFSSLAFFWSCGQNSPTASTSTFREVGGPCENCNVINDFANTLLQNVDTLPDFEKGKTKILLKGKIFQKDGKTPAENVMLYIYHTNEKGIYEMVPYEDNSTKKYVLHRGCIKTDKSGNYAFFTFLPAAYPTITEPKHIHPIVKEPFTNGYYFDNWVFEGDELLTDDFLQKQKNRCGSGVVKLEKQGNILVANRDIILGKNIPDYE